jgi:hypothetical protein
LIHAKSAFVIVAIASASQARRSASPLPRRQRHSVSCAAHHVSMSRLPTAALGDCKASVASAVRLSLRPTPTIHPCMASELEFSRNVANSARPGRFGAALPCPGFPQWKTFRPGRPKGIEPGHCQRVRTPNIRNRRNLRNHAPQSVFGMDTGGPLHVTATERRSARHH